MRRLVFHAVALVALTCFGMASEQAQASSYAFGAGSSFAAVAYRHLFDCLYSQAQGSSGKPGPFSKAARCLQFNGSGMGGEILYEGNRAYPYKMALRANQVPDIDDEAITGPPWTDYTLGFCSLYPISTPDCWSGYLTSYSTGYDGLQFIAGEDPVDAAEVAAWNAAGNPAKFGNIIQVPAAIGAVAITFNGRDGTGYTNLNILPATPFGGSSGLNLSRNALCGIFSGHITQWNNPILTALNGGVLGTGDITVVSGAGGSNFLLTDALSAQCQFELGPNNETDPAIVSYAFPWTDYGSSCPHPLARGAILTNWPRSSNAGPAYDQCGNAITNPGGGHFVRAADASPIGAGNDFGVLFAVGYYYGSCCGAISYVSANYVHPWRWGGLVAANLQSEWDIIANTGQFQPATPWGAAAAMSTAVPQFDDTTRINPLSWSLQGVVPNPVLPGAYPISGFTWLEMYQCYANHANGNNPYLWFRTFLDYLYGSTEAHEILHDNGFTTTPTAWTTEIYKLLTDPDHGPVQTGIGGCATIAGAY